MGQIKVEKNVGGIEGLCVIEPAVHGDARGYFMETYNEKDMKEAGIDIHFVQDNQSIYETFVYKLTEYHQNKKNIKYHVACKANGDGCISEME